MCHVERLEVGRHCCSSVKSLQHCCSQKRSRTCALDLEKGDRRHGRGRADRRRRLRAGDFLIARQDPSSTRAVAAPPLVVPALHRRQVRNDEQQQQQQQCVKRRHASISLALYICSWESLQSLPSRCIVPNRVERINNEYRVPRRQVKQYGERQPIASPSLPRCSVSSSFSFFLSFLPHVFLAFFIA